MALQSAALASDEHVRIRISSLTPVAMPDIGWPLHKVTNQADCAMQSERDVFEANVGDKEFFTRRMEYVDLQRAHQDHLLHTLRAECYIADPNRQSQGQI